MNAIEIAVLALLGVVSMASGNPAGLVILTIAGLHGYLTKELMNYTTLGKDGNIILFLILGFAFNNPMSIMYALQMYGLGFNEPTKDLFKKYNEVNKIEKITKLKV